MMHFLLPTYNSPLTTYYLLSSVVEQELLAVEQGNHNIFKHGLAVTSHPVQTQARAITGTGASVRRGGRPSECRSV